MNCVHKMSNNIDGSPKFEELTQADNKSSSTISIAASHAPRVQVTILNTTCQHTSSNKHSSHLPKKSRRKSMIKTHFKHGNKSKHAINRGELFKKMLHSVFKENAKEFPNQRIVAFENHKNIKQDIANTTLEEGEIRSDDEDAETAEINENNATMTDGEDKPNAIGVARLAEKSTDEKNVDDKNSTMTDLEVKPNVFVVAPLAVEVTDDTVEKKQDVTAASASSLALLAFSFIAQMDDINATSSAYPSPFAPCIMEPMDEDDDDCICVDPSIEVIVLDDTVLETTINENNQNQIELTSSTPRVPVKAKNVASFDDSLTVVEQFFEDISINDDFSAYNVSYDTKKYNLRQPPLRTILGLTVSDEEDDDAPTSSSSSKPVIIQEAAISSDSFVMLSTDSVDDSVIFVGETKANHLSLEAGDLPNCIQFVPKFTPIKPKKHSDELFTHSEKKQLYDYSSNAYNPWSGSRKLSAKRMIIIDGSNVAFNHALNKQFSVKGLSICIEYFEKMGHEVKAIVPQFRMNRYKSSSPDDLVRMHAAGKIVFTPCKNIPGTVTICYDDRFVLQLACELDAVVISNDNYRDLLNENKAFEKLINNRVIGYTWCNDIFILPKDPYGRRGPTLQSILNRLD